MAVKDCFLIYVSEDGEVYVEQFSPEDVTKVLEDHGNPQILRSIPKGESNYWGGSLIIRGQLVVPEPVEVIKEYRIPEPRLW